ncbi:MAG: DNA polymerase III subunit alpha [Elusimicrobiota bacterium]
MADKKVPYVHLHNHSEYSLLDGAARLTDDKGKPSEFIQTMAKMGYPALGLTDHGNLFGAMEFYKVCKDVGIKPIIGMEAYVAPASRFDKEGRMGESNYHLTLLATSREGYDNLIRLSSAAYLEGFHYKPRIDKEILAKYSNGLIGFSGCLKGEIPSALRSDHPENAKKLLDDYKTIFGPGRFYIEIMDHGLEMQKTVLPKLVDLAKSSNTPLVATNDCHYFKRDDHMAHDVVLCIGTGKKITDEKRMKYGAPEFYYKPPEDMLERFKDLPESLKSTLEIAEQCSMKIDFDQLLLPKYEVPTGHSPESYLKELCLEGLKKKKGHINDVYRQRLELELSVINKMGFAPYFLIVWDFIHYARKNGIPVGPGRGSGAGSLVAYSLAITSIDPIENGLLFERFLNPDRRSMPDLDIDFSDEGREQVIQYVKNKYGENCVAQIVTFGSMLARGVIRDVGRVLEMPLPEVDKIAGMIPKELGITIDGAMTQVSELRDLYKKNPEVKRLIDLAKKIEGLKRHTGVHAAGTVISPGDITAYVPLSKNNKDIITTQFDGEMLAKMGLLKVDFLGLRTLTVIKDAVNLIKERHNPNFDIEQIPVDDKKTYALLARADVSGVFQLESSGMRDLLRKIKPSNLSDITALISLYRPGPMGSGMLDDYVARKNDPTKVKFDHPLMKPILEETYGIMVYQEQVMRISQALAGFTPGEADGLRKAMGKKIKEELEKQRGKFIEGCAKKEIKEKLANEIFDLMAHFGGYGFNKSHASAYGLISYQTAFIKANFPVEYMAALCTSEIGRSSMASKEEESKLVGYLSDCRDMKIEVLPPSIQLSGATFTVENKGNDPQPKIRFGLVAIKNVGSLAVESLIQKRKEGVFESLHDFCARVDTRLANKKVVESLIKAGAFDSLYPELSAKQVRARVLEKLEDALSAGSKLKADSDFAAESLFGESEIKAMTKMPSTNMQSKAEWTEEELLNNEKEVLGLYLSGHPLTKYRKEMAVYTTCRLGRMPDSGIVRVAGHILSVRRMTTKRGSLMARFVLEDLEGETEVIVFPKGLTPEVNEILVPGAMLVVKGGIETREGGFEGSPRALLAEEIITFQAARERFVRAITIDTQKSGLDDSLFNRFKELFGNHPGLCRVHLLLKSQKGEPVLLETKAGIKATDAFIQDLEKMMGPECWTFGKPTLQREEALKPAQNTTSAPETAMIS